MKKSFSIAKISKLLGAIFFTLILFSNIQVATLSSTEIACADISIFGLDIELFQETKAAEANLCDQICTGKPVALVCTYLVETGFCYGLWIEN